MNQILQSGPAKPEAPVTTEAGTALAAGRKMALKLHPSQELLGPRGLPYAILEEDGKEVVQFVGAADQTGVQAVFPPTKPRNARMDDLESFIAYVEEQASAHLGARVYAEMEPGVRFTLVIDDEQDGKRLQWRDNRCTYQPRYSKEWETWVSHSGPKHKFDGNEDFALFIENNMPDVISPQATDLLSIVKHFRVSESREWSNKVELANGAAHLSYRRVVEGQSTTNMGDTVAIPEAIVLEIPIFAGLKSPRYSVNGRFRYRPNGAALKLWYELVRPHKVVELAFRDLLDQIQEVCGPTRPVYFGSPDR